MAMSDEDKKELSDIFAGATLDALKKYDSERAEWEANVNAQNGGKGNDNSAGDDKPGPSFAERLLGGSKSK